MRYFITDKNLDIDGYTTITYEDARGLVYDFFDTTDVVAYDIETNGLDAYINSPLLVGFGAFKNNAFTSFCLDVTDKDCEKVTSIIREFKNVQILGHNLKFDYKMNLVHLNIDFRNSYDTMLAEQRLYQGFSNTIKFGLVDTTLRRCKLTKEQIKEQLSRKNTRNEFIGVDVNTYKPNKKQLDYLVDDLIPLFEIKEAQKQPIDYWGLNFLLYGIEFPLLRVVAKMELEGFKINEEDIILLNQRNESTMARLEIEMDKKVKHYFSSLKGEKVELFKRMFDLTETSLKSHIQIQDLFGESKNIPIKKNTKSINFGSADQIQFLFSCLNWTLPTKDGSYVIPSLNLKTGKILKSNDYKITTGADELKLLLNERPNHEGIPFIENLLDYRKAKKERDSFGLKWFKEKVNPVTGKIHSVFRQATALNGRFQSGGGKKEPDKPNFQNFPARKDFREMFRTDDGYVIDTYDLSGAEVTIMASKAQDMKLYELAIIKDDVHSPLIQQCWRNIFLFRACKKAKLIVNTKGQLTNSVEDFWRLKNSEVREKLVKRLERELSGKDLELVDLAQNFIVDKKTNSDKRKSSKNLTFGSVYGCYPKKAAKTIDVILDEGDIYIRTLKEELPDTFKMVESNVEFVTGKCWKGDWWKKPNGYIKFNDRTNSRVIFEEWHLAKQNGTLESMPFTIKSDIENATRNLPISGTQADIIKEAMVEIQNTIDEFEIDAVFLNQVHDELVVKRLPDQKVLFREDKYNVADNFIKSSENKGKSYVVPFNEFLGKTMQKVANRYLLNMKMGVDGVTQLTWTK